MTRPERRSQAYQHFFKELPFEDKVLACLVEGEPPQDSAELKEARIVLLERLTAAYWRLLETHCTPRQLEIMRLVASGLTQVEAAKVLGVNQSSIIKALKGNIDYRVRGEPRRYGGVRIKMRRRMQEDAEIQAILRELRDLSADEP